MRWSTQRRARAALAARLREQVGADALHPGGEHALRFADALVPTLTAGDVEWAYAQLRRRAKGELRPARSGTISAHAAWSSTALVASAFAAWRGDPTGLRLAGRAGFTGLRLEERLPIPHGGGTPNVDVALEGPGTFLGVESKLTEHLAPKPPRPWRPAYRRASMAAELDGGWAEVFAALLEGTWAPRHLDAGQLVRHALSLTGRPGAELALVFWEPAGGDELPEVRLHREEVAELLARVGPEAVPRLHAVTWAAAFDGWEPAAPRHVAALRRRYAVALGS